MNRETRLRLTGYILFFLFFLLVFSFVNYPRENLANMVNNWLTEASDNTLSVENVAFTPGFSLKLGKITANVKQDRFVLGDAVISPLFLALLTGKKGVKGNLEGPWGSSDFKVHSRGDSWNLDVHSLNVQLDTAPLPEDLPVELSGEVQTSLELNVPDTSDVQLKGQGQLSGIDIQAQGEILEAFGLSPLRFSSLSVFFTIEDNVLTLNENSLTGDVSASARGTVRIIPDQPGSSRLNLTLDIKPEGEIGERLSPVLPLLGVRQKTSGNIVLKVRGTIQRPIVSM